MSVGLHLDADELVACVACGLCLPHCPTYRLTGLEAASPRGRVAAMQAVQLQGAPLNTAFADMMDACMQCRGCEAACPSSVPFGRLMEASREALAPKRSVVRRAMSWLAYRVVLPRHGALLALTWLLLVAQRLHLVPRRFGLPSLSARELRTPLAASRAPNAYLYTGCVMDAWLRPVHRAALRVMQATGARPGLPGRGGDCCGALHAHAGRLGEARALAHRVIASMPGDGPIVVDSAGCGAAMKDYGRLLGTASAHEFSARVRDFAEWLAEQPPIELRDTAATVVVQDPCHLRHVQHAEGAVRTVLCGAYRLADPDDDGLCCGAGGAYLLLQPELARRARDRKVDAIMETARGGEFVVASANPGCMMHLGAAGLPVRHPAQLVEEALP